jgi:VanZ family protein
MSPTQLTLGLYLMLVAVAVSCPLGPSRAPHKLRWLNDTKPVYAEAVARDVATNVALFLPAGLLAGRAFGASAAALAVIVVSGSVVSLGIETAQHLFMPWRYSSWIDVVSNTAGTAVGAGTAWLLDPARAWIGSLATTSSGPSPGHQ